MAKWILYSLIQHSVTVKRANKSKTSEFSVTKQTASLVGEILSGCVRLVLAIGLCVAVCDLAKSMKATSLLELSKSSEDCKVVFQNLTNDMVLASHELISTIAGINTRLSSVTNTLSLSMKAVDDLKRKLEANAGK